VDGVRGFSVSAGVPGTLTGVIFQLCRRLAVSLQATGACLLRLAGTADRCLCRLQACSADGLRVGFYRLLLLGLDTGETGIASATAWFLGAAAVML
jgi:hypothetical protein